MLPPGGWIELYKSQPVSQELLVGVGYTHTHTLKLPTRTCSERKWNHPRLLGKLPPWCRKRASWEFAPGCVNECFKASIRNAKCSSLRDVWSNHPSFALKIIKCGAWVRVYIPQGARYSVFTTVLSVCPLTTHRWACSTNMEVPDLSFKWNKIRPAWNNFLLACWWISLDSSLFSRHFFQPGL